MPKVLVLGGVGFIGRNFIAYLIENDLAKSIRVVDKVLPAMKALLDAKQAAEQAAAQPVNNNAEDIVDATFTEKAKE